jgi:hypothetical protein
VDIEKRTEIKAKTWEETAQAYNGTGKHAVAYREFVERLRKGALAAKKKGKEFIPENL